MLVEDVFPPLVLALIVGLCVVRKRRAAGKMSEDKVLPVCKTQETLSQRKRPGAATANADPAVEFNLPALHEDNGPSTMNAMELNSAKEFLPVGQPTVHADSRQVTEDCYS